MEISRSQIIKRSSIGTCPNCGAFGLYKHWFRLNKQCKSCEMSLESKDAGFYFATTSIGYVLAIFIVIIPICIFVIQESIDMWTGVLVAIVGSLFLTALLYPLMLSWVILGYYTLFPQELPANSDAEDSL